MIADYLVLHPQVATQTVEGLRVLVLADSGEVLVLNCLGTRIVELLDNRHSVAEVADVIERDYEVSASDARSDLDSFIQTLLDAGALTIAKPSSTQVGETPA